MERKVEITRTTEISSAGKGLNNVNWGIMSAAKISYKFKRATDLLNNHKETAITAKVFAIASRDEDKAEEWKDQAHGFTKDILALEGYDELIARPEVQAIYIPLPSAIKKEYAFKAAKAGKHLLLEKPYASATEVRDIQQICKQNGVMVMDGTMFVHNERQLELMKLIKSGALGTVLEVNTVFTHQVTDDSNIRLQKDKEPHGALGDLGWYNIKFSLSVYQWEMPEKVFATCELKNDVIVSLSAILWFSGGRRATFTTGFQSTDFQNGTILGTKKSILIEDFAFPYRNSPIDFPKVPQTNEMCYVIRDSDAVPQCQTFYVNDLPQESRMVKKMNEIINSGQPDYDWFEQTYRTQAVLDAIELSARKQTIIQLSDNR